MKPLNEREKSGISFALGAGVVVALVGHQTQGDLLSLALTIGLPSVIYGFWSVRQKRFERARVMQESLEFNLRRIHQRREVTAIQKVREFDGILGTQTNENPLAYVPTPHRGERRVLLPRDHEVTKQRILQGREAMIDEAEFDKNDQWHS